MAKLLLLALTFGGLLLAVDDDQVKTIESKIKRLRALPDDQRGKETLRLALAIRAMEAGEAQVSLAYYLSSRATEGDPGPGVLQDVTTTLAKALERHPMPSGKDGSPHGAYVALANLARYEHVQVSLSNESFGKALAKLDADDRARVAADFTLTDLQGNTWTLSKLKGQVVLVNFWATWCPPCRKEMPDLDDLFQQYKEKSFVVLAITDEDAPTVTAYLKDHPVSYPVLLDPGREIAQRFAVDGIPKSFVFDRDAKLVALSIDMRTKSQFLQMLSAAGLP